MSTPYSSAPRVKVRNSPPAATGAAPVAGWIVLWTWLMRPCSLKFPLGGRGEAGAAHHARRVQDQGHAAVAEDRRPGDSGHAAEIVFQAFHHDLLLPDQLVDQQG